MGTTEGLNELAIELERENKAIQKHRLGKIKDLYEIIEATVTGITHLTAIYYPQESPVLCKEINQILCYYFGLYQRSTIFPFLAR